MRRSSKPSVVRRAARFSKPSTVSPTSSSRPIRRSAISRSRCRSGRTVPSNLFNAGVENPDDLFVAIEEPVGVIEVTIERERKIKQSDRQSDRQSEVVSRQSESSVRCRQSRRRRQLQQTTRTLRLHDDSPCRPDCDCAWTADSIELTTTRLSYHILASIAPAACSASPDRLLPEPRAAIALCRGGPTAP